MDWFSSEVGAWALIILGNLSFALTAFSYAQKNVIKLRLIAILATTIGLVYNSIVHLRMPDGQNLWPVLFWLGVLWIQNIALVIWAIRNEMEMPLSPRQRSLAVAAFPDMHSRDWAKLIQSADLVEVRAGDVILAKDAPTTGLTILAEGRFSEDRPDKSVIRVAGQLWGELTFVFGNDEYNASPCSIVALTDGSYYVLPYDRLKDLTQRSDRMRSAIYEGIVRSAGFKHGLLHEG